MPTNSPPDRHAPPQARYNGSNNPYNSQRPPQPPPHASRPQPITSSSQNPRFLTTQQVTQRSNASSGQQHLQAASGAPLYRSQSPAHSAEHLLPPKPQDKPPSRNPFLKDKDVESVRSFATTVPSGQNSRRNSWSSGSDGESVNPFDDSRAPSRAGSDDEGVNTQTVSEKYNITPSAGLLLYPEDVEKDDYLHTPDPNDKDKMEWSDIFSTRGLVNVGGLAFLVCGILILFIGYPVLTFVKRIVDDPGSETCSQNPLCLNQNAPLLKHMRQGLIDPDTPSSAMSRTTSTGGSQQLVFSDEFNYAGRTFYDEDDPFWAGVNIWYGATHDIEWYDPDALTTQDGYLAIRFDAFENHGLNYRSGMLQSWNKLCFKGGYMEASISLPGQGHTSGFWPGFWSMGNLGRPGYLATTDGMWPYSYYDECDAGITANQSDPEGLSYLPGMRLPACTCTGQDHPSPGISRSAPEIDAIEATVTYLEPPAGDGIGQASQSFQTAPFDVLWRPNVNYIEVYDRAITMANAYQGGPTQEAISAVTNLNNAWYDGNGYQSYAFEYSPGSDGYITWYVGPDKTWTLTGEAIGPNGNVGQRVIPEEPMSIIVNFGMADNFAPINFTGLAPLFPATMRIDYVRIYQDEDGQVTCDPDGYPSTQYIKEHPRAYLNPNMTTWENAGYSWPQNSYVDDCQKATSYKEKREYEDMRMRRSLRQRRNRKRSWMPWS